MRDPPRRRENESREERVTPEVWEEPLEPPKMKNKIRKPIVITKWFGEESDTSDESTGDEKEWSEVERKRKNLRKKKLMKEKNMLREQTTLKKAANMVGIGPIKDSSIRYFEEEGNTAEEARKCAVREFLVYQLGFTDEEVEGEIIKETKRAKAEDIIYISAGDEDFIREIYYRKSDSRNDYISIRNYIPPQLHARFMCLNIMCSEKRKLKPGLKTQIRFGKRDLELFTKMKGEEEPLKKVELEDFMEIKDLPAYDHSIHWKISREKKPRGRIEYSMRGSAPPSLRKEGESRPAKEKKTEQRPSLIRQHSATGDDDFNKKARTSYYGQRSGGSEEEQEEEMEEEERVEDNFQTPRSRQISSGSI